MTRYAIIIKINYKQKDFQWIEKKFDGQLIDLKN